jgi:hypothetical protein
MRKTAAIPKPLEECTVALSQLRASAIIADADSCRERESRCPITTAQGERPMNKPTVVEIPQNADERVVRIQLEQITKAVTAALPTRMERVVVTMQQESR